MLSKLLKPKWKHSKSAVRREALMAMGPAKAETQAILTDVITNDIDLGVRRLAVKRSTNMQLLKQLADNLEQAELAADASKRLCRLLAGQEDLSPPLTDRLELIANLADPRIDGYLIQEAPEAEVRLKVLERVDRQAQLGDIALADADPAVRLAAAQRIEQRSTLERVAKQSRRKDKAVFSLLNEKLNADSERLEQRQRHEKQLKLLCAQIDALLQNSRLDGQWLARQAEISTVLEQWPNQLAQWEAAYGPCDEALVERFQRAQRVVEQALEEKRKEHSVQVAQQFEVATQAAAQDQYRQQLQTLLNEMRQSSVVNQEQIDTWSGVLADLRERGSEADLQRAKALLADIAELLSSAQVAVRDALGLKQLIINVQAKGSVVDKNRIESWRKRLATYQARQNFVLDAEELQSAQIAIEEQQKRLQEVQQSQIRTLDEIAEKLRVAEQAFNAGEIYPADKLLVEIKNQWADSGVDTTSHRYSKLLGRYQHLSGQIRELNDWRRWSTAPVLEELVANMETLAERVEQDAETQSLDYTDVAQRVRDARAKWKSFGVGGAARAKDLWGRFDQACNKAYAPCQVQFEKLGAVRASNLQQRVSTCDDLQAYLTRLKQQTATEVDWQVVAKIIQTARQEWSSMGTVERQQFLAVNKRFNHILGEIHALLAAQRTANFEAKTQLIKHADRLANEVQEGRIDLRQAIDDVKTLQGQWKSVGPAEKDRSLWTEFRNNCDRIFQQRDAQREEQHQAQEAQQKVLQAIIERLEGLSIDDASKLQQPLYAFEDIKREWVEQAVGLRRNPLQKRFEHAAHQFQQTHKNFLLQQKAQLRQQQQQRAELCVEAEHLLWTCLQDQHPCADQKAALEARWQMMPEAVDSLSSRITERYKSTLTMLAKAVNGEGDNIRHWLQSVEQQNRQLKEDLCLRLEVLCGAPSPDDAKQARVSYQVSQLERKMKQGDVFDQTQQLEDVLLAWHKSGMVLQPLADQLTKRFSDALAHCEGNLQ